MTDSIPDFCTLSISPDMKLYKLKDIFDYTIRWTDLFPKWDIYLDWHTPDDVKDLAELHDYNLKDMIDDTVEQIRRLDDKLKAINPNIVVVRKRHARRYHIDCRNNPYESEGTDEDVKKSKYIWKLFVSTFIDKHPFVKCKEFLLEKYGGCDDNDLESYIGDFDHIVNLKGHIHDMIIKFESSHRMSATTKNLRNAGIKVLVGGYWSG